MQTSEVEDRALKKQKKKLVVYMRSTKVYKELCNLQLNMQYWLVANSKFKMKDEAKYKAVAKKGQNIVK